MAKKQQKETYCSKCGIEVKRPNYRRIDADTIYCRACHAKALEEQAKKMTIIEPEIVQETAPPPVKTDKPKKLGMNPLEEEIIMTPEIERDKKLTALNKIQTLAELNAEISKAQELTAAMAKHADILHVPMIDGFNNIVLDELTSAEGEKGIRKTIKHMLKEHDIKGLRMLLAGMRDLNELREMWLASFDDTRQVNKPKVKIQAVFSNDGNVGVNVETK